MACVVLGLVVVGLACTSPAAGERAAQRPIKVRAPQRFSAADIPASRSALGIPEDYKPWIVRLSSGELLVVAFHAGRNPVREYAVFWRSRDGGKTWSRREPRPDVAGREFSLSRLSDGTLLMPCHFLKQDSQNSVGHTYSKLFRSVDSGRTWNETRIGPDGFPPRALTNTDRDVIEIPDPRDPKKLLAYLGISLAGAVPESAKHVFFWRSRDGGLTWDKTLHPETGGWDDYDGFFGQSATHRTNSGKLLHVVRVDRRGKYWEIPGRTLKGEAGDQGDRMMIWESTDSGRTWKSHGKAGTFGTYGEMYPRFLTLKDGRLLLTFTVRSNATDGHALGLRAIVSNDNGETWDFKHDRLIVDDQNQPPDRSSGGGYGNTVQLADGKLVSVYSYRGQDGKTHVEAVRWELPARQSASPR
jgi:hypothetical protein